MSNSNKIKILFITPSFSQGGAEKNILNIINAISNDDFKINLVICKSDTDYLKLLNKEIDVCVLDKLNVRKSLLQILKILINIKPEIVFSSALHISIPILILKKILFLQFIKISRIPSLPSNKLGKISFKNYVLNLLRNRVLSWSDKVIAQTSQMKDEIVDHYRIDKNKVIIINNLIDVVTIFEKAKEDITFQKGDDFIFVAAGSLYSVKGFDYLIKAFAIHAQKFENSKLLILGRESVEKGYSIYLEKLIIENKLEHRIILLGHKTNPYKYFKFADAFVLSSIKEGFPNVVLENLILQKPVLVTNCIDFSGIITNCTGIIVEKGSIEELADGLNKLINFDMSSFRYNHMHNFNYNEWFKSFIQ